MKTVKLSEVTYCYSSQEELQDAIQEFCSKLGMTPGSVNPGGIYCQVKEHKNILASKSSGVSPKITLYFWDKCKVLTSKRGSFHLVYKAPPCERVHGHWKIIIPN